ncbi:LOW QUALITY PROTEIN: hypothetical protein TorRG33x02_040440, partial [Trema orientale]
SKFHLAPFDIDGNVKATREGAPSNFYDRLDKSNAKPTTEGDVDADSTWHAFV